MSAHVADPVVPYGGALVEGGQALAARRRSAVLGAVFSEFIDMFDIYLPVVVLTPVLSYFQPTSLDPATQAILTSLVFITTLLGRPVGSLLFGMMADRAGRRIASITSVAGFGFITFLIALLPGYGSIGVSSYWLLVVLRFLDGVCLGGGYTGSIPLAFESSEKAKRGLTGGLIMAAFPAAYIAINLLAVLMFALFPLAGPDSPYVQWGWRLPFLVGALLAGLLALYYVFKVSESEIWQAKGRTSDGAAHEKLPLSHLLRGRGGRSLGQIIVMMTGFWLTQNIITIALPTMVLGKTLHLAKFELTATLLVTYVVLFFSYIAAGLLGQRIGRRRFFILAGAAIALVATPVFAVLVSAKGLPLPAVMLLVGVLAVIVTSPWGLIITYINERFATDVRATGFGVGFGLSVIIPSFYAFYMNWLGALVPFQFTPVLLLGLGGLLGAVGAAVGPETNDVDF